MFDTMLDLEDTFASLHAVASDRLGDEFFVNLQVGKAKDFPAPRNMAYTTRDRHGDIVVVVAPKLAVCEDMNRVEGVLRHEFGHAALWHMDKETHSERDADSMGENLFGAPIYYDAEDVQTLAHGNRPRPTHLPK